jgi:hypothetical protein
MISISSLVNNHRDSLGTLRLALAIRGKRVAKSRLVLLSSTASVGIRTGRRSIPAREGREARVGWTIQEGKLPSDTENDCPLFASSCQGKCPVSFGVVKHSFLTLPQQISDLWMVMVPSTFDLCGA